MPRSFIFFNLGAILIEPLFRLAREENEYESTSQSPAGFRRAPVGEGLYPSRCSAPVRSVALSRDCSTSIAAMHPSGTNMP